MGGPGSDCEWIEEFFLKPLSEAEEYELDQDILKAQIDLDKDFTMDFMTWQVEGSEESHGHHLLTVDCTSDKVAYEEVETFEREKVVGTLGREVKELLIETMERSCERQGGVGFATEVVRVKDDVHEEIEYDGEVYYIVLKRTDDVEEVARYHCKGIGMEDEPCKLLEEEMKTWTFI